MAKEVLLNPDPPRTRGVLLGPQRNAITVTTELAALGLNGRIAAITAGWQEREAEDDELQEAIGRRAVNLRLHARLDDVFRKDPELFAGHRARQDRVRQLQDLYRMRLSRGLEAARELLALKTAPDLVAPEVQGAIEAVQALDAHHMARIQEEHDEFEARWRLAQRDALAQHRDEVRRIVQLCEIVAIAGGHVATLLSRIRLLDVHNAFGARPVIAWSAGAMVCTDRVVLFHDRPPEGPGNAELLEPGLGIFPGVVALPHATRRLALADTPRMALFASRFAPAVCVGLDPRCRLGWDGTNWHPGATTQRVGSDGRMVAMAVAS